MAEATDPKAAVPPESPAPESTGAGASELGSATYEIIRQRLESKAAALQEGMAKLDTRRAEVFGSIESKLLQADRIVTAHNCIPRDMIALGDGRFLFAFNVRFGLKKQMEIGDVFAIYRRDEESGTFREEDLAPLRDERFLGDFQRLYNVYERTAFRKFALLNGKLYMKFGTGATLDDFAVFVWEFNDGNLRYLDGRAEAEYRRIAYPPPHQFRWLKPDREAYRYGDHPHVSIEDRVFVETVGGDLTIKVEDNTASGEGIYSEPVDDRFQKVDDAAIEYGIVNHLIILKIRPYKEQAFRYFIFNEKQQTVVRVDSIGDACALLPESHGLVFPDGYYLSTGGLKRFDSNLAGMVLDRVLQAPSGEDVLYIFHSRATGEYALLPYRIIPQKVEERITCHGFSIFPNGHLLVFRAETEPQKHHLLQLRQTPFHQPGYEPPGQRDTMLYNVGNKEVVRCLAACNEVLSLARKKEPYAELYTDLVKACGSLLDSYPWLAGEDGFGIAGALAEVREAADKAVDEFDRVRSLRHEATRKVADIRQRCTLRFQDLRRASFQEIGPYVENLAGLRQLRGELIQLRETRYIDLAALDAMESEVANESTALATRCAAFLLEPAALAPYRDRATNYLSETESVRTAAEGRKLEEKANATGGELEMLIEIVNSLPIEDATETTRIIDGITTIYTTLNQVRAALRQRLRDLAGTEGRAKFAAQMKLLSQTASGFLDLCDTPAKCDEYLNRISVQLEEMDGAFADFEEFTIELANKRAELSDAFEQRRVALVEARNRKAGALATAAQRILKAIETRLASFKTLPEIHSYLAGDMMISRVRETVKQLIELGDAPKADEIEGRLKAIGQEAARQLKDRDELFTGGGQMIQLGRHQFNVNTKPLDLTVVLREGVQHFHITSTQYFAPITDEEFLATRQAWDQEIVSENQTVYRGEYLAWQMLETTGNGPVDLSDDALLEQTRAFMAERYQEGYTKGVHDLDGTAIYRVLRATRDALGLARFAPEARACALVYWHRFCPTETKEKWSVLLDSFAERNRLFPGDPIQNDYIAAIADLIREFLKASPIYPESLAAEAGEYLFHQLTDGPATVITREAAGLLDGFQRHLALQGAEATFASRRASLAATSPASELSLIRDWIRGYLLRAEMKEPGEAMARHAEEACAFLFCGNELPRREANAPAATRLDGLKGTHPRVEKGGLSFDYLDFQSRLRQFTSEVVPRFNRFLTLKQERVAAENAKLRLGEFRPRVLSSFVRNELINTVYLPLVGDNLAKQIGAAGDARRTDLMGLLLVISPPGYGKTTLLEYVASRLGIVFVKINGPALGHQVTSLDPEEAPNAAARQEIIKLNLALEMGDNALICVDDIQHCNPEFLQKFISLCDGQRRIEGVWNGKPRTYDLRGRKVVVVMAGNPYTESGQKFRIPDMLANRADTYNLGDIIGGSAAAFKASYIENAVTSNAVLAPLANKSQKDIRAFIRIAETGSRDGVVFEASYSPQETEEILSVMKKLVIVRETVLRVNQEYIASAAQADEFRVEPPFRLQGSYRNMNRLAEKVVPVMNDAEVRALLLDHYRGESQTLTTGAESNLLKFKEMVGALDTTEAARWEEIKKTFRRNTTAKGTGDDPAGRVVASLTGFQDGLDAIRQTMEAGLAKPAPALHLDFQPVASALGELRADLTKAVSTANESASSDRMKSLMHELEMVHSTLATLKNLAALQRDQLQASRELLETRAKQGSLEIEITQDLLGNEAAFLEKFHEAIAEARRHRGEADGDATQAETNPASTP
jgi:hypothetical protein